MGIIVGAPAEETEVVLLPDPPPKEMRASVDSSSRYCDNVFIAACLCGLGVAVTFEESPLLDSKRLIFAKEPNTLVARFLYLDTLSGLEAFIDAS
jgi:hypothetical protein